MTTLAIQKAAAFNGELPEMPIDPTSIHEGSPEARGTILVQSDDKRLSSGQWSCTAGRFEWTFGWDEFVYILEGEATIQEDGGETYTVRVGDIAHFPLGLKTNWHVPEFVKKVFTIRTPEPFELG